MGVVEGTLGGELLPALARVPGHLLWRASARVTAAVQHALPRGLDVHAYGVLLALGDGGSRTQQDLADAIGTSRTTLTKVAAQLVDAGLVERVRNPDDRRSYLLSRTDAGSRTERTWRAHVDTLEDVIAPDLGRGDRDRLRELLQRVVLPRVGEGIAEPVRRSLGFLLTKAHALAHREAQQALAPWGVEPRHLGTATTLRSVGPVPQARLADAIGVTPATVVQIVDDMERLDLVRRERDPADRRAQLVSLTDDGREVIDAARRAADDVTRSLLTPLDADEREQLLVLLRRVVAG